jgi:hypothetical protein
MTDLPLVGGVVPPDAAQLVVIAPHCYGTRWNQGDLNMNVE